MEISQLAALRAIAETGSFSEAANRLNQTQPALSHKIRNLEDELGETLLIRARPRVYPTRAGELLLSAANRVLSEIGAVLEQFPNQRRGSAAGTIRVAATNLGMMYLFADLCEAFIRRFPTIELTFRATETPDEAVRRVVAGAADVAFGPIASGHTQLTTVPLGSTEHVLVVGRQHPLASHKSPSLSDVRKSPFIRFEVGSGSRALSDSIFLDAGGYPPIAMESNDVEFIKRVVAMGLGVALLPAFALRDRLGPDQLVPLTLPDDPPRVVPFGMCYRTSHQRRAVELLKRVCLEARGPAPLAISAANAMVAPFASSESRR